MVCRGMGGLRAGWAGLLNNKLEKLSRREVVGAVVILGAVGVVAVALWPVVWGLLGGLVAGGYYGLGVEALVYDDGSVEPRWRWRGWVCLFPRLCWRLVWTGRLWRVKLVFRSVWLRVLIM